MGDPVALGMKDEVILFSCSTMGKLVDKSITPDLLFVRTLTITPINSPDSMGDPVALGMKDELILLSCSTMGKLVDTNQLHLTSCLSGH